MNAKLEMVQINQMANELGDLDALNQTGGLGHLGQLLHASILAPSLYINQAQNSRLCAVLHFCGSAARIVCIG